MIPILRKHIVSAVALLGLSASSLAYAPINAPLATGAQVGFDRCNSSRSGISIQLGKLRLRLGPQRTARSCCSTRAGYYKTVQKKVWVQGCVTRTWVPAQYRWQTGSCGNLVQVLVRAGHYQTQRGPGHYETRTQRVWVAPQRICRTRRHGC